MLGRVLTALTVAAAITSAASAQDVKRPQTDFGRYHALVIGNNDYQHLPKLKTAVVDAVAVGELLRLRYSFKVKLLLDATRLQILEVLNAYRRDLTERDNLLVYYAGHGVLDRETDTGFWLPVDAKADSDSFWIPNADLSRRLRGVSARHVLVVADSCYAGTLVREAPAALPSGAERTAWVERMNGLPSRTALVSGGLEPVMDRGGGNHSVFAKAFLEALRGNDDVLDGHALFRQVSRPVVLNAPDQTPRYSDIKSAGHEGGEFMFVPLNVSVAVTVKSPATPVPTTKSDSSALELTFWQSIQNSSDPADFKAYLEAFPEGTFAPLARSRIKAAEEKQAALMVPPKPAVEIDPVEAEYVAVKDANVREEPTVRSSKVTTLKRGTAVQVAGKVKDKNWYLVERGDKPLGYVFGDLLKDAETVRQERAAQQEEEDRERAEEARRREEERKRVEQSKLALAPPPRPASPVTSARPALHIIVPPAPPVSRVDRIQWNMQSAFGSTLDMFGTLGVRLSKQVETVSDGRIRLKLHEPGSLVPALKVHDAVGKGRVDSGWTIPPYFAGREPSFYVFGVMPFGPEATGFAVWLTSPEGTSLRDEYYRPHGLKSLICGVTGPEGGGWFKKPIRSVAGLRGLKMRSLGLGVKVLSKLGVRTRRVAAAKIYPLLERGAIDAAELSTPYIDLKFGFHRAAKTYHFPGWHGPANSHEFIVNLDKWRALSAPTRRAIEHACANNLRYSLDQAEPLERRGLADLRARGVDIRPFPQDVIDAARRAWQEVVAEESAKDPKFARAYRALQDFRRRHGI